MNTNERDILLRLNNILTRVPFPNDGMGAKTASIDGYIEYQEDMRALVPMMQKVIMGAVWIDTIRREPEIKEELFEGLDYDNPLLVLDAIEQWIMLRNSQKWRNPDRYGIEKIYDKIREAQPNKAINADPKSGSAA